MDTSQELIGRVGRVTGTVEPGRVGEVMVPIRGGSEAFHARAADPAVTLPVGTRIVVVEYHPPRSVLVTGA
jgi:membrane protein implicated in regulation of membrane protease activity